MTRLTRPTTESYLIGRVHSDAKGTTKIGDHLWRGLIAGKRCKEEGQSPSSTPRAPIREPPNEQAHSANLLHHFNNEIYVIPSLGFFRLRELSRQEAKQARENGLSVYAKRIVENSFVIVTLTVSHCVHAATMHCCSEAVIGKTILSGTV
jgi:hypothetical protein